MKKLLVFIWLAALLQACVPSINPLYHEQDLVFEEFLLGEWKGGSEIWTFHSTDKQKYTLDHFDGEHSGSYTAHLLKLEGNYYLDITAKEIDACNYLQKLTTFDVHTFVRLDYDGEKLDIHMLSYEKLDDGLEDGSYDIQHVRNSENQILLTADTESLQSFVINHAELFDDVNLELNKVVE